MTETATAPASSADAAPTSPAAVAAPPAAPSSPKASAALAPGWRSSEAWVTLLTMILGAIPSSGLTADAPLLAKIVGMAIAAVAALHYTAQRTSLKRAHLAARSAPVSKVPAAAIAAAVAIVVAFGSCSGSGLPAPIVAGGKAFLQCGKQDLTQLVGSKGWTLLATVNDDLAKDDYGQLITDLITTVGNDAIGCAVVALDSLGKTSVLGPRALTPRETRAKELIVKYKWETPPAASLSTAPPAAPSSPPAPPAAPPSK